MDLSRKVERTAIVEVDGSDCVLIGKRLRIMLPERIGRTLAAAGSPIVIRTAWFPKTA